MSLELRHLAADLLGLPPFSRQLLSSGHAHGVSVARNRNEVLPPVDRFDHEERAALTRILTEHLSQFAPHVAVLDSIHKLEQPNTTVVLASATAELFGANLESLYAALHAIAAANELAKALPNPVVPMLWIDAETNIAREEARSRFRSSDHVLQSVRLPRIASEERTAPVRDYLAQLLGHCEHAESSLRSLVPRDGESLANAFTRTTLEHLGSTGLLVCQPDWLRFDLSHFLARIVSADPALFLKQSTDVLHAAGFPPEQHLLDPTLVHRMEHGTIRPLHSGEDGFYYEDEPGSRTTAELAAEIVQEPQGFLCGRTLLPLLQDLALPTVVRIVKREDLFREAALDALRSRIGSARTPVLSQLCCTLVDAPTRNSLSKLDLEVREVCGAGVLLEDVTTSQDLESALEEFRSLSRATSEALHDIARPLWHLDPRLRPIARRAAARIRRALDELRAKSEHALRNHSGHFSRHQRLVNSVLLPDGHPQHQVDSLLSWLAPFGPSWILELTEELDPFAWEHLVVNFP